MENKLVLPAVGISLLACIALMLAVIGGLYAYNTFAGDAPAAYAQSSGTDVGPRWTVTPVTVGGNQELLVVVTEDDNMLDPGNKGRQMSVYELRTSGIGKAELYFVGARLLEYDSKLFEHSDVDARRNFGVQDVKKAVEQQPSRRKK